MSVILIPFTELMKKRAIEGKKNCTSRVKKYGIEGDVFFLDKVKFQITCISHLKLDDIARGYYEMEGFNSPTAFRQYWTKLHPKAKFKPEQRVYFHIFKQV